MTHNFPTVIFDESTLSISATLTALPSGSVHAASLLFLSASKQVINDNHKLLHKMRKENPTSLIIQARNVTVMRLFVRSLLRNRRKTASEKPLPLGNVGLTQHLEDNKKNNEAIDVIVLQIICFLRVRRI
jgi:hypothetical protein